MEPEDTAKVMNGLRSLHKNKLLYDYTIEVEDQEFKVHKVVLASVSDYFKVMLTGGMRESQTDRVRLAGLDALAVSNMIDFIYTGEFGTPEARMEVLIECAVYLQIPGAIRWCVHSSLCDLGDLALNLEGFQMLSMFQKYSVKDGVEEVRQHMIDFFDEFLKEWNPEEMSHHDVKNLIDIWQNSEWDLYLTIKQWVELDSESRQQHVSDLMGHLRYALMTPEQLQVVKGCDLYSGSDGSWREMVDKAVGYHSLPTYIKVFDDSKQDMVRKEPCPFYFNSDGHVLYELSKGQRTYCRGVEPGSWERREALNKPEMKHGIETCVVVNNFLIVCETFSADHKWHILDPRTMKWSSMAHLEIPRRDSALVSCNQHLYVLGGRPQGTAHSLLPTDVIERYDSDTNSWSVIPSKLPIPVSSHGAAVLNDCIYVAGGRMYNGNLSTRLDCLDTTYTWHSKAKSHLEGSHRGLGVMKYKGEEVLFILCADMDIVYYSPSKDSWSTWRSSNDLHSWGHHEPVHTELRWCADGAVLRYRHMLYLLNFNNTYNNQSGVCAKWTLDYTLNSEWNLPQLPVDDSPFMFMLLSIPQQPSSPWVCHKD